MDDQQSYLLLASPSPGGSLRCFDITELPLPISTPILQMMADSVFSRGQGMGPLKLSALGLYCEKALTCRGFNMPLWLRHSVPFLDTSRPAAGPYVLSPAKNK